MVTEQPAGAFTLITKSQRQHRRKRRLRHAKQAGDVRTQNLADGIAPGLFASSDYWHLAACGWDLKRREMRMKEPPTRQCPADSKGRINRRNAWHQEGDAQKLVAPIDAATWLWWLSLDVEQQDEMYELSAKANGKGDGISHDDPSPLDVLNIAEPERINLGFYKDGERPK